MLAAALLLIAQIKRCTVAALINQRWWKDADGVMRPLHALDYCLGAPEDNASLGTALQVKSGTRQLNSCMTEQLCRTSPGTIRMLSDAAASHACYARTSAVSPCLNRCPNRANNALREMHLGHHHWWTVCAHVLRITWILTLQTQGLQGAIVASLTRGRALMCE